MSDKKQTIAEAAEAYANDSLSGSAFEIADDAFHAGAAFALNSDEVRGLVKDLTDLLEVIRGDTPRLRVKWTLAHFEQMKAQVGGE